MNKFSFSLPCVWLTIIDYLLSAYDWCDSYTMACPHVRRASASGLSYVQADKHGITILHHRHQCRPC